MKSFELLEPSRRLAQPIAADLPTLEPGLPFDKKGNTFLDAVMMGVGQLVTLKNVGLWQRSYAASSILWLAVLGLWLIGRQRQGAVR